MTSAAAARLRERAANVRPDEDLAASIAANAAAGDEFAKAYAALRELGLHDKSLDGFGLEIVDRVPIKPVLHPENIRYLQTKQEKMGHLLGL